MRHQFDAYHPELARAPTAYYVQAALADVIDGGAHLGSQDRNEKQQREPSRKRGCAR
jgi:hypothetical protein